MPTIRVVEVASGFVASRSSYNSCVRDFHCSVTQIYFLSADSMRPKHVESLREVWLGLLSEVSLRHPISGSHYNTDQHFRSSIVRWMWPYNPIKRGNGDIVPNSETSTNPHNNQPSKGNLKRVKHVQRCSAAPTYRFLIRSRNQDYYVCTLLLHVYIRIMTRDHF